MKNGDVFKGDLICVDCEKPFIWVYQYRGRQRMGSGLLQVIEIYEPKKNEAMVNINQSRVYCPKCGFSNSVEVKTT